MWTGDQLTTSRIHSVFADEIAGLGGTVTDVCDDGQCLFVRWLNLMPLLSRFPSSEGSNLLRSIMHKLMASGDTPRYGLMNAVTAVARETRDPDQRWRLEEFGGGILALVPWSPSLDPIHAMPLVGS